jgi:acetyl-CoA acetyltransferase
MTRRVAIIGAATTKQKVFNVTQTWEELLAEAIFDALEDCDLQPRHVENAVISCAVGALGYEAGNMAGNVSEIAALAPAGVVPINGGGCASGGIALYQAYALVASGLCDIALAAGFEKGSDVNNYLETACVNSKAEYDYAFGLTHVDWLALITDRYSKKHNMNLAALIEWVENRHWFAQRNPKAFSYGQPMPTRADLMANLQSLLMARTDGAAAVVVASSEVAARMGKSTPIYIDGMAYTSESIYLPHKFQALQPWQESSGDLEYSAMSRIAVQAAFKQANLTDIRSADHFMVTDGTPAIAFIGLESLGLYPRGKAWKGVLAGEHGIEGRYPTNTHGGSLAFGGSAGAMALADVEESVRQMRGLAEDRQLPREVQTSVCLSMGGSNSNSVVTVLRRE